MVFVVHTRNLKGSSAPRGCVAFVCVAAQVIEVGNHGAGTCSINVVLRFCGKQMDVHYRRAVTVKLTCDQLVG